MKKVAFCVCTAALLLSCDKLDELYHHHTPNGKTAGALDFDGQDDEVNLGDWFRYQVFTIQFWAKPGATQNTWADIIDNDHYDYTGWVLQQNVDNTNEYVLGSSGVVYFKLQAVVWQQVTLVRRSDSLFVYVNGALVGSAANEADILYRDSHNLRLGNWAQGGRNWNGQLDDVRLWNRALTQEEIQSNMNCQLTGAETGLVAYYKFNQGHINADNSAITTLTDASANGHDGALSNFALTGGRSNWVAGKVTGTCY